MILGGYIGKNQIKFSPQTVTKCDKYFFWHPLAVLNSNFHRTNAEFITDEKSWTGQLKPVLPPVAAQSSQL